MHLQPMAQANNPGEPWQFGDAKPLDYGCWNALLEAVKFGKFNEWDKVIPEFKEFCKENGYNPDEELSWIVYVDANSLYPTAMTMQLPQNGYAKVELPNGVDKRLDYVKKI